MQKIMTLCGLLLGGMFASLPSTPAHAGTVYGPFHPRVQMIAAHGVREYTFTYWGSETAAVLADANGDVDIYVFDSRGNLVTFDDELDWIPLCEWTPSRRQVYTIQIVNRENYPVQFDLDTN